MKLKILLKTIKKQYVRSKNKINKNLENSLLKYSRSDITEEIIKKCRGVKKSNDGVNRLEKEKPRENCGKLLGFKENEIFESKEYSLIKK